MAYGQYYISFIRLGKIFKICKTQSWQCRGEMKSDMSYIGRNIFFDLTTFKTLKGYMGFTPTILS